MPPSIGRAFSYCLNAIGSFLGGAAAAVAVPQRAERTPLAGRCNRYSAKMPTKGRFALGGSFVKLCYLGNLGVDFRAGPNFNRLE